MRSKARGVSVMFVAVALVLIAAATLAFLALTRTSGAVDRSAETANHLARVAAALEQFASTAERLPCPANPALDTGDAEPNMGSPNCTYPGGTVPWRTIGLRREDSIDAWGSRISYRAYSGANGLTQDGGASMVLCDTNEPTPAGATAAGLCRVQQDTTEAQFLAGKGLALNDFGTPVTDAAYVLISHGPTGLGAYTAAGSQRSPLPASADETGNLGTGPFVAKAAVLGVAPEDPGHFDDVLAYRRLADFVKRANLGARDWPEPTVYTNVTFDSATVGAATGSPPSPGSLGQPTINVAGASITAFDSGGNQDLSFESSGGTQGIGGTSGGNLLSSAAGEGLRVTLTQKSRQLAVTLWHFGRFTGQPGNPREQARFTFYDGTTQVYTFTGQGCHADGGLATFAIDAGVDFDRVDIAPIAPTSGTSPTEFLLVQLKSCAAGAVCKTSLSTGGNLC